MASPAFLQQHDKRGLGGGRVVVGGCGRHICVVRSKSSELMGLGEYLMNLSEKKKAYGAGKMFSYGYTTVSTKTNSALKNDKTH